MGERRKQETAASYGAEIKRVLEQPDEEVWRFYPVGDGSRCEIRPARPSPRCTAEGAVMKTLPDFTSGYLTRAEFDDRATAALTATSQAGLDALTADLKSMKPAQSSEGEVTMMRIEYDAL